MKAKITGNRQNDGSNGSQRSVGKNRTRAAVLVPIVTSSVQTVSTNGTAAIPRLPKARLEEARGLSEAIDLANRWGIKSTRPEDMLPEAMDRFFSEVSANFR